MIITIDTNKDSLEDIKRAVNLLKQLSGEGSAEFIISNTSSGSYNSSQNNQIYSSNTSNSNFSVTPSTNNETNGFAAMFGDMGVYSAPANSGSNSSNLGVNNVLTNVASQSLPQIIGLPPIEKKESESDSKRRIPYDFDTY